MGNGRVYHVAGADVDLDMLRVLTPGDKVLAVLNGQRPYSTAGVNSKIADDHPWIVEAHDPGISIVLSNAWVGRNLRLDYSELITSSDRQPAVFLLRGREDWRPPGGGELFVILQLISCRTDEDGVASLLPKGEYDEESVQVAFEDAFDDERIFVGLLEVFCDRIDRLTTNGWGLQSVKRFAMRTKLPVGLIRAYKDREWSALIAQKNTDAGRDGILRIAHELHYLPTMVRQSELVQHSESVAEIAPIAQTGGRR
jgi:hypothetical protein